MKPGEYERLSVFSSGSFWETKELRLLRADPSITEVIFVGVGENAGRRLIFRGLNAGHPRSAVELYLGFDHFVIIDLKKDDWQREAGRFQMHIFRDEHCFKLAFDSYSIDEVPDLMNS